MTAGGRGRVRDTRMSLRGMHEGMGDGAVPGLWEGLPDAGAVATLLLGDLYPTGVLEAAAQARGGQ